MGSMMWTLEVEPEQGEAFSVVADQRDVARFEAEPFGWPITQIQERAGTMFWRYLAWTACRRTGKLRMTWEQWGDKIVDVTPAPGGDGAPDDAQDPGSPAPSDTPS
jgi:hypothetical protein